MSHQNTAPWPTLPAPRTQAEADLYIADGGASPSNPDEWPVIGAMIAAHPGGCPLPMGWLATDPGFRLRMDIYQSGELGLFFDRIGRVGAGEEAGKTWGESVQISLPIEGELADVIASAEVRTWTSGYTAAEVAEQDRRTGVFRRIQVWANSREAATIPWGGMNEGGRRDIADCLDAIDAVAEHPRRGEWIATVKAALHIYPVARAGLERCIRDLGQAEVFGLAATASTPLFILGAADAEMTAIESLLRECGQDYAYATFAGRRVAPGQKQDDGLYIWPHDRAEQIPSPHDELVAVEVAGPWGQPQIDHHDGSERATWGPERFLAASSIGQVISWLASHDLITGAWPGELCYGAEPAGSIIRSGREGGPWVVVGPTYAHTIPQALVHEAAADHCPAAAVAGLCPGVDPGAFAPFLAESKRQQYFPAMSAEDFARELEISRATLLAAPPVTEFCDPHPAGFSPDLPPEVYLVGATPDDCPLGSWVPPQEAEDDGDGDMGLISSEWLYICRHEPDGTPVGVPATAGMLAMRDLRHLEPGTVPAVGSGECYPSTFLVGIVAALFEGVGFVCRIRRRDGRLALRSNGHGQGTAAGTLPAEVFLADPSAFGCGPTQPPGQDASYGNPVRGFFGGTLIDQG